MELLDLSELFTTKPEAEDFSNRLALIEKEIFETSFNPEKALLEQFGIRKKEVFMTTLRNNKINVESRIAIKEFIDKIQQKIASLTVISLVLAFEPTDQTLQGLSRWFVLNAKKQVLFEIKVDKSIIGGASILSGGRYLDYSIKPAFDRVFTEALTPKPAPAQVTVKPS